MANIPTERTWLTGFRLVATRNRTSYAPMSATPAEDDDTATAAISSTAAGAAASAAAALSPGDRSAVEWFSPQCAAFPTFAVHFD
jgi:hypothetical protein